MSKAVHAQGARKCGPRDAQDYSFDGFRVLMLPSFMKGGDIFLLYLCFSNVAWVMCRSQACLRRCGIFFSQTPNEAKASAVNKQQLAANTTKSVQAARKPRASCAQAREAPARHLAMLSRMSLAARFKQWTGSRNMHFPSFRLCPSCVAEPAVLSVGSRVCCWPRITGADLSGKSLCGLLCERRTH